MAATLAPHAVAVGLQPSRLAKPGRGAGTVALGFRVTEKTPQHLRGALTMQADRAALLELSQLLGYGRSKQPDPALLSRDADEAGNAVDGAP